MENIQALLRRLPKVDQVLQDQRLFLYVENTPRPLVVEAARETIEGFRRSLLDGSRGDCPTQDQVICRILEAIGEKKKRVLKPVCNATGVVLHTNLGRARLSRLAKEAVEKIGDSYCTLEYDLASGGRGSRHQILEGIIKRVTGAEAAMVVNNNAAATMLVLAAMARGKEAVVSRGELVEIGGSFRIPDVMKESGALLREVGTTNKTRLGDYREAYVEGVTGIFLKVHTSNYRILGFTEDVELSQMAKLGRELSVPVVYDMGSGLLVDLKRYGVQEPTVAAALEAGAQVVLFSGDKLLGGPQGGIIIGEKKYIDLMKKHPLARAFRVDKMTLAAMEATFYLYIDQEWATREIPVLGMICTQPEELRKRAERLKALLEEACPSFQYQVEPCLDQVGGGSAPTSQLPGYAVAAWKEGTGSEKLERRLRGGEVPVIVRMSHDKVLLDVRTLAEEELGLVAKAFSQAEGGEG